MKVIGGVKDKEIYNIYEKKSNYHNKIAPCSILVVTSSPESILGHLQSHATGDIGSWTVCQPNRIGTTTGVATSPLLRRLATGDTL